MDPAATAGDYLEKHHVYQLFENLMQQLIIHKPNDPIEFLITQLQQPAGKLYTIYCDIILALLIY